MKRKCWTLILFTVGLYIQSCLCFLNPYPQFEALPVTGDVGEPLLITPLIKAGKIKEARERTKVLPLEGDGGIKSYSGYFTVNEKFNSNLFFWYFPSQGNTAKDPVLLWLQGGPGATSLFGLFSENGPFYITKKMTLQLRKFTWIKSHSVIYIDNPVGTGYSFTNEEGYAKNETIIGKDLYSAITQFYQLFPELQKNTFFITGESYAGKYIPAVSYVIHKNNRNKERKINLQGLAIGNGACDPAHMLRYSDYLYQLGLIDSNARDLFQHQEDMARKYIQEKQWAEAYEALYKSYDMFTNVTGYSFWYNYLHTESDQSTDNIGKYIQQAKVRKAIHVGNATFHSALFVALNLVTDYMQSVKPWIEELLEHYQVLIYSGQLDIIVAYPLTVSFLQSLSWSSSDEYKNATRIQWHVGNDIAGYVKTAGHLTEVLVRNAGHMVPSDQPKWAFDLITRFTARKPYY